MWKRKCWNYIMLFSLMTFNAIGQSNTSNKLGISMGGGFAFPVGSFAKKSPSMSAIYHIEPTFQTVIGFSKDKNGFAKTGFCYDLEMKYKISKSLRLLLLTGTFTNAVETDGMSNFLNQLYDERETLVEHESYKFLYVTPGIGYDFSISKFEFGINLFLGYSMVNFPYYKFVLLFSDVDPPPIYAHDGPMPNLKAFTSGTSLSAFYSIFYRLRLGIELVYLRAGFNYSMSNRYIPGGSTRSELSDILKLRVINSGIRISYSF